MKPPKPSSSCLDKDALMHEFGRHSFVVQVHFFCSSGECEVKAKTWHFLPFVFFTVVFKLFVQIVFSLHVTLGSEWSI